MAEITRRRTGESLRKLFEILKEAPEGLQAKDALAALEGEVLLSEYEAGDYEKGGRRFDKIVRFATVDCDKAGWMQKNKGRWSLTDAGWQAYQEFTDPEAFYARAARLYREWRTAHPVTETEKIQETDEALSKSVDITFEQAEEQAWQEIKEHLLQISYEFQELVASLLHAMGYFVSWVAPPGKDGGTDIIALVDPLGTRSPRIKVQVKRQKGAATVQTVRSFIAVIGETDVGLFVCTGGFTRDAGDEARTQEKRRVTLIDLDQLFELWVKYYEKLSDEARQRLPLKPIHFLAPAP